MYRPNQPSIAPCRQGSGGFGGKRERFASDGINAKKKPQR
jgi:hypothetical protein